MKPPNGYSYHISKLMFLKLENNLSRERKKYKNSKKKLLIYIYLDRLGIVFKHI